MHKLLFPLVFLALTPALALPARAEAAKKPHHAAASPASGAAQRPGGPKSIGQFQDWQAATHEEAGQLACYAFTRATASSPALPGRGAVVLTVTQRPSARDGVAVSAGFPYAPGAEVALDVGGTKLPFYTAGRAAFAKDGHAVVAAFRHAAGPAAVSSPAPHHKDVVDTFSLRGFPAAYAAIDKACPK